MATKFNAYETVTNKIIALMEEHGSNWCKPWAVHGGSAQLQHNANTGRPYQGMNQFLLMWAGYSDNRWGPYGTWQKLGAQVRKGETATRILKPIMIKVRQDDGTEETILTGFSEMCVFNAEQCEGVSALPPVERTEHERIADAEAFVANTGAVILHGDDSAYYSPVMDHIGMPDLETFKGTGTSSAVESYYSTLLHELTHWTMHKSRCNRNNEGSSFGNETYAFEELVAELGATFACASLGISPEPRADHAQYLNAWIKALKDDDRAIMRAASQAQKAHKYLEGLQPSEATSEAA